MKQNKKTRTEQKITDWVSPSDKSGEFKRGASQFRNFISREPGAPFPPEKGRYHLYVSYACPWGKCLLRSIVPCWHCLITSGHVAQRTMIVRKLKGLESFIPVTSVHWHMLEKG
jgi:glutathionyl-hydroquinone reductase